MRPHDKEEAQAAPYLFRLRHNSDMKQIRENVYQITFSELGKPPVKGMAPVMDLGQVHLDEADMRYIKEHQGLGFEPTFFISRSAPMGGQFVVIGRQEKA